MSNLQLNFQISQGSMAKHLRWGDILFQLFVQFVRKCNSERISKIWPTLAKVIVKIIVACFYRSLCSPGRYPQISGSGEVEAEIGKVAVQSRNLQYLWNTARQRKSYYWLLTSDDVVLCSVRVWVERNNGKKWASVENTNSSTSTSRLSLSENNR